MRRIICTISLIFILQASAFADVIILKSQKTIKGKIIEETPQYIRMDLGVDIPITFFKDEIDNIQRGDGSGKIESKKSFLWKVQSARATVYFFGSIHLGKPSMYPLKKNVEDAFAQSSALVVEFDTEGIDPMTMQREMMSKGMYPENEGLEDNLSNDVIIKLKKYLRKYNLSMTQFSSLKPWLVSMMLTVLQVKKLGFDEKYGVDYYFLRKARGKKRILELESFERQLDFLDNLPNQSRFLEYSLYSLEETEKILEQLIAAWKAGDAEKIENFMIVDIIAEHPEIEPIFEKLLYERNVDMADRIREYLNTNDTYFVVVGAGHLVGDKGLVEIFRSEDYTVEQL